MILHAIDTVLVSDLNEGHSLPVDVSIEHLLPQKWQEKAWPISNNENAGAIRASLIHTIGNLTLVKQKLNLILSRRPWTAKRLYILEHSSFNLNRPFLKIETWDEESISKRTEELFKYAVQIWSR